MTQHNIYNVCITGEDETIPMSLLDMTKVACDGEASILELWEIWSTTLLILFPSLFWTGLVVRA